MSPKGERYINSARPDHQSPLLLPLTVEMVDEDQQSMIGGVGELKSMSSLDEGLSEVGLSLSPSVCVCAGKRVCFFYPICR